MVRLLLFFVLVIAVSMILTHPARSTNYERKLIDGKSIAHDKIHHVLLISFQWPHAIVSIYFEDKKPMDEKSIEATEASYYEYGKLMDRKPIEAIEVSYYRYGKLIEVAEASYYEYKKLIDGKPVEATEVSYYGYEKLMDKKQIEEAKISYYGYGKSVDDTFHRYAREA